MGGWVGGGGRRIIVDKSISFDSLVEWDYISVNPLPIRGCGSN